MDLTQQAPNFDADEEFFNSENMLESKNIDALQQISSLSRQQIQEPFTENLETMPQQSTLKTLSLRLLEIDAQSIKLGKTESLIPSDDESSTVFDQKFDEQETLISKQSSSKKPSSKKRKLHLPDSTYFTITCNHCSHKPQFHALFKFTLIRNFKRHSKNEHSNITDQETEIYIKNHLQEPEQRLNFSVRCPEPKCKHIVQVLGRNDLKRYLFNHLLKSKKHQSKRNNYSKESIATHVEDNYKQTLVSAQEQLKNTQKRKRFLITHVLLLPVLIVLSNDSLTLFLKIILLAVLKGI